MGLIRPPHRLRSARAFSLVEMLTVIVIIGILGSMITAAVIRARIAAMNAAIKLDIGKLEAALGAFKEKFGEYPPDCYSADSSPGQKKITDFLARAFPRYSPSWSTFNTDVSNACGGLQATKLDPTNALVFWLGGLPDNSTSTPPKLTGFSANVAKPIESSSTTSSRIPSFLEFDPARLKRDANGWPYCVPPGNGMIANTPYVFFRADPTTTVPYSQTISVFQTGSETVTAYRNGASTYPGPNYQIISAGLDGKFGAGGNPSVYPGPGANGLHADNVTSFTKTTIEAEK